MEPSCKSCGKKTLVQDFDTENIVCRECCVVQEFSNFQSVSYGYSGPVGTNVKLGTSGTGTSYLYKETKIYEAKKLIKDLTYKLDLSEPTSNEVTLMIDRVTEGEFGTGHWFPVCIGACSYIVMRRDRKILTVVKVVNVIGCDRYELGQMIKRVVAFLGLELPGFDTAGLLEHCLKSCSLFNGLSEDVIWRMLKQGVFLVQCSMIWFLTTGRTPMPVVVAVLTFVSELNDIQVKIEDLAAELGLSNDRTCKMRKREIVRKLVEVGRNNLPWGKDVTVKNIVKNAPFIMRYMELKSMKKGSERSLEPVEFDLDDVLNDCFSTKGSYNHLSVQAANESQYFNVESSAISRIERPDNALPLLSHESLALLYSEYVGEIALLESSAEKGVSHASRNRSLFDFHDCGEWWTGKSDLSKKLLFEQILEKDIGLNANPPSFDQGHLKYQKRKVKIEAAKLRIERIMHPSKPSSGNNNSALIKACVGKKRKKREVEIDWEDFIIEALLLHQVKEEEIAKGHYKALIDLYVFRG